MLRVKILFEFRHGGVSQAEFSKCGEVLHHSLLEPIAIHCLSLVFDIDGPGFVFLVRQEIRVREISVDPGLRGVYVEGGYASLFRRFGMIIEELHPGKSSQGAYHPVSGP